MTQKERQEHSRKAIIQAAQEEFGHADFDTVTMDSICAKHGISKGMMYHYYANKDQLFLACVGEVFRLLHQFLTDNRVVTAKQPAFEAIKQYFLLRETFFRDCPEKKHIFENAMLFPPKHLAAQIRELRAPIKAENDRFLQQVFDHMNVRKGVSRDQAAHYLYSIYTVFWTLLKHYREHTTNLDEMLKASEEILDMMLFGIVDRESAADGSFPGTGT